MLELIDYYGVDGNQIIIAHHPEERGTVWFPIPKEVLPRTFWTQMSDASRTKWMRELVEEVGHYALCAREFFLCPACLRVRVRMNFDDPTRRRCPHRSCRGKMLYIEIQQH